MDNDKIIKECYQELYINSTPSASFEKLMKNAPINERGQKVIDFMNYSIEETTYNNIIANIAKKYKLTKLQKIQLNITIALGCSPTFK